jgi:hypothetical protein
MADEFNRDPWRKGPDYIDRTYPSGVARVRPLLTTRIHCEPDDEVRGGQVVEHDQTESACERFNRQLRGGHSQMEHDEE